MRPSRGVLITVALAIKLYLIHRYLRYAALGDDRLFPVPLPGARIYAGARRGRRRLRLLGMHLLLARRWLYALLCFATAILFHYTKIVFVGALIGALIVPNRTRVVAGVADRPDHPRGCAESVLNWVTSFAGWFNPLADICTEQIARGQLDRGVNSVSVFNLTLYASLISALVFRWFNEDRYRRVNVLLALASILMLLLF